MVTRFDARVVFEALAGLKTPNALEPSQTCLGDKLHLQEGDELRQLFPEGFKTLGRITEVGGDYFLLAVGPESIPLTYAQANELIENEGWDFVRPTVEDGATQYQKVKTYLEEQQEKQTEKAKESAEKQLLEDLQDPRFRIYYEQNQKLGELTATREQVQKEYEFWLEDQKKIRFSKYAKGYYLWAKGKIDLGNIPDVVNEKKLAEYRTRLENLDGRVSEIRDYLDSGEYVDLPEAHNDEKISTDLAATLSAGQSKTPLESLENKLDLVHRYRHEKDNESALVMAAGALWGYRTLFVKDLGSLERDANQKESLTAKINRQIRLGNIKWGHEIVTAQDLLRLSQSRAWTYYHQRALRKNEAGRKIFGFNRWLFVHNDELERELTRLAGIEKALAKEVKVAEAISKELYTLEKILAPSKVKEVLIAFGEGCLDILDDPATMLMVLAGAGAGAVGRAVMIRLAARGFSTASTTLLGLAVEGIVFHNVQNLGLSLTDPNANHGMHHEVHEAFKGNLDPMVRDNLHSIVTLGWLKTVGKVYGDVAKETYFRIAKTQPVIFKILHQSGSFGSEVAAFASQGALETSIALDQPITWESLTDELVSSTQMVIGFRTLRYVEQGKLHHKGGKSVTQSALERAHERVFKAHQTGEPQELYDALAIQTKLQLRFLEEQKEQLRTARKMKTIGAMDYEDRLKEIEVQENGLREVAKKVKELANQKGLDVDTKARDVTVQEAFADPEKLRRSQLLEQLYTLGARPGEKVEPLPPEVLDELAKLLVDVYQRSSPILAEHGKTWTLRALIKLIDLTMEMSLRRRAMPIFLALKLILPNQFSEPEIRSKLTAVLETLASETSVNQKEALLRAEVRGMIAAGEVGSEADIIKVFVQKSGLPPLTSLRRSIKEMSREQFEQFLVAFGLTNPPMIFEIIAEQKPVWAYDYLAQIINGIDARWKGYGIYALGKLGDPRAIPIIRNLLANSRRSDFRRSCIHALINLGVEGAFDLLGQEDKHLNHFEIKRETFVEAVSKNPDYFIKKARQGCAWGYDVVNAYIENAKDKGTWNETDPAYPKIIQLKTEVIQWIQETDFSKYQPEYHSLNWNPEVVFLITLGAKEVVPLLKEKFRTASDINIKTILGALALLGDRKSIDEVRKMLGQPIPQYGEYFAPAVLIAMGDSEALSYFKAQLVLPGDREIRAIAKMGGDSAKEYFRSWIRKSDVAALERPSEVMSIFKAMDTLDPNWDIAAATLKALYKIIPEELGRRVTDSRPVLETPEVTLLRQEVRAMVQAGEVESNADIFKTFIQRSGLSTEVILRHLAKELPQEEFLEIAGELNAGEIIDIVAESKPSWGFDYLKAWWKEYSEIHVEDIESALVTLGDPRAIPLLRSQLSRFFTVGPFDQPQSPKYNRQEGLVKKLIRLGDFTALKLLNRFLWKNGIEDVPIPVLVEAVAQNFEYTVQQAKNGYLWAREGLMVFAQEKPEEVVRRLAPFEKEFAVIKRDVLAWLQEMSPQLEAGSGIGYEIAAAQALMEFAGVFKIQEAAPILKEKLGQLDSTNLDAHYLKALALLGDAEVIAHLKEKAKTGSLYEATILLLIGDPDGLVVLQNNPAGRRWFSNPTLVPAIARIGTPEAIKTLKMILAYPATPTQDRWLIIPYLDKLEPGWDKEAIEKFSTLLKIIPEELERKEEEATTEAKDELARLLTEIPQWNAKDFADQEIPAEKREELEALIPSPQPSPTGGEGERGSPSPRGRELEGGGIRISFVPPTVEAMEAIIAGLLANIPVYLEGETGVGKNLILQHLAHQAQVPFYRINFSKETDHAQLYGHYEVQVVEGKKRVVITDGKMIEAMRYGGWVMWDEVNLAQPGFLVAQNDIVQQIATGKVLIKQGGKVKAVSVHKNFRLFAAGNPEGYAGRKALEATFADRWFRVVVREFSVEDQRKILREGYPDLSAETVEALPAILNEIRVLLGEGSKKVTLRTLKRIARRIVESGSPSPRPSPTGGEGEKEVPSPLMGEGQGEGGLWEILRSAQDDKDKLQLTEAGLRVFLEAIEAEILDGLNEAQYQNVVEGLERILPRGDQAIVPLLNREVAKKDFDKAVNDFRTIVQSYQRTSVPESPSWEDLVPVETTVRYAFKVLDSLKRGDHLILEGIPAVAKSAIPKWLGKLLGQEVIEVTGSKDQTVADLVGMPTLDENGDFIFEKGYFVEALERGAILVVNEGNLIPAEVWERLNSVFDDTRNIYITENGIKRPIKAHPNFRIVITLNPEEFRGGRSPFSAAMENRFRKIVFRQNFKPEELQQIVSERTPALQEVAEPMVDLYLEAGRILAEAGHRVTLRDLNRWQDVATALAKNKVLKPHEALVFGAELVFAGRVRDEAVREQISSAVQRMSGKVAEDEKLREGIRAIISAGATDLKQIYESLATREEMELDVYLGRSLQEAESETVAAVLEEMGWGKNKIIFWASRFQIFSTTSVLREWLKDEDVLVRLSAAEALGKLGNKEAIPDLRELLKDENAIVCSRAAEALGELGAKEAIPDLRKLLKDRDTYVRSSVAAALAKLGATEAIPNLQGMLEDGYAPVRWKTAEALGNLGDKEAIPELRGMLQDGVADVRLRAAEALGKLGDKEVIPGLRGMLKDENALICWRAAEALGELGATEAIPDLRKLLRNENAIVRLRATEALGKLGDKKVIPDLLGLLKDGDANVRSRAAEALGELGAIEEISDLRVMLRDRNADVCWSAAKALDQLQPGWDKEVVERFRVSQGVLPEVLAEHPAEMGQQIATDASRFLDTLRSQKEERASRQRIREIISAGATDLKQIYESLAKQEEMRLDVYLGRGLQEMDSETVVAVLEEIGWDKLTIISWAKKFQVFSATSVLQKLLKDGNGLVRWSATGALGELGAKEAIPDLWELLKDEDATVRSAAAEALGELGATEAIPKLRELLRDGEASVRFSTAEALGKLGAKEAIPDLQRLLGDEEWVVRSATARALGELGATEAIPKLRELLQDEDASVRFSAAEALGKLGVKEAIQDLQRLLKDENADVRMRAAEALGKLGAKEAIPNLRELLIDRNESVRFSAAEALGRLGAKEAIQDLQRLLKDENADVRMRAAEALVKLGVTEAIQDLRKLLNDVDPDIRWSAAEALGKLGATDAIPDLRKLLNDVEASVRWSAAEALGELGAKEAIPDLRRLLRDGSGVVCQSVSWALDQLQPGWDKEVVERFRVSQKVLPEVLAEKPAEVVQATAAEAERFTKAIKAPSPQPSPTRGEGTTVIPSPLMGEGQGEGGRHLDSDGKPIPAEKLSELQSLIPSKPVVTMVSPMADAIKAVVSGVLSKTPVYVEGETGVGKNLMFNLLAHEAGVPLYRINFGKETDNAQLYGHYEVQVVNGKKRVVITDGKMIEAMRYGGWVLWDEVNLAQEGFLASQNDIVQQIQSGRVLIKQGGKIKTIKVHENFRLFADGNPEDYAGRKKLEATFADRWLKYVMRDLSVEDQRQILKEEYGKDHGPRTMDHGLSEESVQYIPQILNELKLAIGSRGPKVTVRTLKRVAERIKGEGTTDQKVSDTYWSRDASDKPVLTKVGMRVFVEALEAEVLDGLNPDLYNDVLQTLEKALPRGDIEVAPYLNQPIAKGDFDTAIGGYKNLLSHHRTIALSHGSSWEDLVPVPTTVKYASKVLDSLQRGDYLILEGPPAVSKSAIPKWIGKLTGQEVIEVTGSKDQSVADLVGMPTLDENGNFVFEKGYFVDALERGAILVVNEGNLIPANVWERLNSVFDADRNIFITENGEKRPISVHPNFRLVITLNPEEFRGGRSPLSAAMENKFRKIVFRDNFTPEELRQIVSQRTPALASVAEPLVDIYLEAGRILAGDGYNVTLRDLNRIQDLSVALAERRVLSPAEALVYGAELVFAGRVRDEAVREQISSAVQRMSGKVAEDEELRQGIRAIINAGATSVEQIYESLAKREGMELGVYLGRSLREADSETVAAVLEEIGWDKSTIISWVSGFQVFSATSMLRELLKDGDAGVRSRAAEALGELGATESVQDLLGLLQDENLGVRSSAAEALGRLGAKEAIPDLRERLREREVLVRSSAAEALGNLGDKEAIPELRELLKNWSVSVRSSAAKALGKLGAKEATSELRELLKDRVGSVRSSAAEALVKLGVTEAIQNLRELLKDRDEFARSSAAKALCELGDKEAIPDLRGMLKDMIVIVRSSAAEALGKLGATEAIPELRELLNDGDAGVRSSAALALDQLQPGWDKEVVERFRVSQKVLAEVLAGKTADTRKATAGEAIDFLATLQETREAKLRRELRELAVSSESEWEIFEKWAKSRRTRLGAVLAVILKEAPPEKAKDLVDRILGITMDVTGGNVLRVALNMMMNDNNPFGIALLYKINPLAHRLVEDIQSYPRDLRIELATLLAGYLIENNQTESLRILRETSRDLIPHLLAMLQDNALALLAEEGRNDVIDALKKRLKRYEAVTIRLPSANAICRISAKGSEDYKSAIKLLETTLTQNVGYERVTAAMNLAKLGWRNDDMVRQLVSLARDYEREEKEKNLNPDTRRFVIEALGNLPVNLPEVVALFTKVYEDQSEYWKNRLHAVSGLGKTATPSPEVIELLIEATKDSDDEISNIAVHSLGQVGFDNDQAFDVLVRELNGTDHYRILFAIRGLAKRAEVNDATITRLEHLASEGDTRIAVAANLALNKFKPGWNKQAVGEFKRVEGLVKEVLEEDVVLRVDDLSKTTQDFSDATKAQFTHRFGVDSNGQKIPPEKLSELQSLIPSKPTVTMVPPMADAIKAVVSGVLSKTPVYVEGETAVGKNLMFNLLAHEAGVPLYRINFGKETDHAQLYGHYEVIVEKRPPSPQPSPTRGEGITNSPSTGGRESEGGGALRRRVVITDGKMIEAMRYGGWVLWDEANLAQEGFLASQNDIVQQIQSGRVLIKQGGKIKTVKVHENFRLFATGNPEGYVGRKKLEATFADRWLKYVMRELSVEDQRQILKEEYGKDRGPRTMDHGLSEESVQYIPQILHELKLAIGSRGPKVTVRTLKRVAERIKGEGTADQKVSDTYWSRDASGKPVLTEAGMRVFVEALEAEVLDGLSPDLYNDAIQALEKALPRGAEEVSKYLNREVSKGQFDIMIEEYEKLLTDHPSPQPSPTRGEGEELVPVPTTLKYASKVLDALQRGVYLILEGPPAVSKSAIPKWIGKLTGQEVIEVTGSKDHSVADLVGMPTLDEDGNFVFEKGYFVDALERGAILVVNEGNLIPAEVWERLNSVFDADRKIFITENGEKRPIDVHPNFRLVITLNPQESHRGGRSNLSAAMENKFRKIYFRENFAKFELHQIARVRIGLPYEELTEGQVFVPMAVGAEGFIPQPVARPTVGGVPVGFPQMVRSGIEAVIPAEAGISIISQPDSRFRGKDALDGDRINTIFGPPKHEDADRLTPIDKEALDAKAKEAEKEIQRMVDTFMTEHGRTLDNLGSLAARRQTRVVINLSVDIAAMDLDKGILYINPLSAKDLTPRQIAAVALHEGGHGAITRMGDRFFFKKKSRHFLNNCIEDPRVNGYMLARLPGAEEDFRLLYEDFFPDPQAVVKAKQRREIGPLGSLPHEQFALGFIDLWANGHLTERITHPEVRAELEKLQAEVREIWKTLPDLYQPREREVRQKQREIHERIKAKILPVYERFYEESVRQVSQQIAKGEVSPDADGAAGPGGTRSPQGMDWEDLTDEAKKILENRAGKMADKMDPKPLPPHWRDKVRDARAQGEAEDEAERTGKATKTGYVESDFRPYGNKTFRDLLGENKTRRHNKDAFYAENPYRKYFDPVRQVAQEVAEALKQLLKLDTDFELEGNYTSGQRLNVRKAIEVIMRNEAGIFTEDDFKLFLRKRFPTKRSHKFVLVLDESGSMKGDAQTPALQAMMLFQHVMEALSVDYGVIGFSDFAQIHKDFAEAFRTLPEKNELASILETSGGGGTNDLEGMKVAHDMLREEEADDKTIIVVTDGQGVNTIKDYVTELRKQGYHVIAIGIGPGTEFVNEVYGPKNSYHDIDFRNLAKVMVSILSRRLLGLGN